MPWFLVDDALSSHPKARAAGLAAMGLWALSGSYASQYLTEGFVPEWFVLSWPQGRKHAQVLVDVRLWAEVPGGWQFHQWDERQPAKERIEAGRAATRDRQKRWRDNKRDTTVSDGVSNGVSNGVTDGVTNAAHAMPCHKEAKTLAPAKPAREQDELFDALVDACDIDPKALTASARGSVNGALKQLRAVAATPPQIRERANAYRRTYPNAALTPTALVKHWAQLNGHKPPAAPYHQEWPT